MIPAIISASTGALASGLTGPIGVGAAYAAFSLSQIVVPGVEESINAWQTGFMSWDRMRENCSFSGLKIPEFKEEQNSPAKVFPSGITGLSRKFATMPRSDWEMVISAKAYLPSPSELNILWQRSTITTELYEYSLRRQFDSNQAWVNAWKKASYEIPGASDLVRFAVREAYNPQLIIQFGYHHEVPTQVIPWMEKQGYGGPTDITIPAGSTDGDGVPRGGNATWFDLYWWSHWELPSLTAGYEMLHKLYSNSPFGPSPLAPEGHTFDGPALEMLQKAQDIPDYWRKKLQAISFNPIFKSDAEFGYEYGLIGEAKLYHIYRQHGLSDEDSKLSILLTKRKKDLALGIDPGKAGLNFICQNYKMGVITDREAHAMLLELGYLFVETERFIDKCKLELRSETVREVIKGLEQAFYRGAYSREQIKIEFDFHKLNPDITDAWLKRWTYNRDIRYKPASTQQNLRAFRNGIMSEGATVDRLFNLGYDGNSINIMIANSKAQIIEKQTQILLKQQKASAKAAKAAQDLVLKEEKRKLKQAQQDAKIVTNKAQKRLSNLIKVSSDANIKAWYKAQLIALWEVYYRLYLKGYTIIDAERWVQANFQDLTKEQENAASTQAAKKYRNEGNYLE